MSWHDNALSSTHNMSMSMPFKWMYGPWQREIHNKFARLKMKMICLRCAYCWQWHSLLLQEKRKISLSLPINLHWICVLTAIMIIKSAGCHSACYKATWKRCIFSSSSLVFITGFCIFFMHKWDSVCVCACATFFPLIVLQLMLLIWLVWYCIALFIWPLAFHVCLSFTSFMSLCVCVCGCARLEHQCQRCFVSLINMWCVRILLSLL